MKVKGIESGSSSEESKKALQSETRQKTSSRMKAKKEVEHYTEESAMDNAYGQIWAQVVQEYLKTVFKKNENNPDIVVNGVTYKTLKRSKITVFYDAAGDTLFDVTNKRLEREYEWLMNSGVGDVTEKKAAKDGNGADGKGGSAKQRAEEKLKKEMETDKDKSFAEPIISYLLERCKVDAGLAQDVMQEHKTWKKCIDYIYAKAKKQATGNRAAVRSDVVFEWAEDYYRKDDKAEEEAKVRKEAEKKEKRKKEEIERKGKSKEKIAKESVPEKKEKEPVERPKSKQTSRDLDGQIDLFSMMEM